MVFVSDASLGDVIGLPPGVGQVWERDLVAHTTHLVSFDSNRGFDLGYGGFGHPAVSSNGGMVWWADKNGFLSQRVMTQPSVQEYISNGMYASLSGDGTRLAFITEWAFSPNDTNGGLDVYARG